MNLLMTCTPTPCVPCAPVECASSGDNLIAILIAIAATSAAVIAIMCGFIFSRFLPGINGHEDDRKRRDEVITALKKHRDKRDDKVNENAGFFPYKFLLDNVDRVMSRSDDTTKFNLLMTIFDRDKHGFDPHEMQKYCRASIEVWNDYKALEVKDACTTDGDLIPLVLKDRYAGDELKLETCKSLAREFRKERAKRDEQITLILPDYESVSVRFGKNEDEIRYQSDEVRRLEEESDTLEERIKRYERPGYLTGGIVFFSLYAVSCVILPLVFAVVADLYTVFEGTEAIEILFVSLFAVFLVLSFVYLGIIMRGSYGKKKNTTDSSTSKKST